MAFRTRKVFGTFEKRGPGPEMLPSLLHLFSVICPMDSAFHPSNNWGQVASETPCKSKEESNVTRRFIRICDLL